MSCPVKMIVLHDYRWFEQEGRFHQQHLYCNEPVLLLVAAVVAAAVAAANAVVPFQTLYDPFLQGFLLQMTAFHSNAKKEWVDLLDVLEDSTTVLQSDCVQKCEDFDFQFYLEKKRTYRYEHCRKFEAKAVLET